MKTNLTKAAVAIPLALTMIIPSASPILANDGMGSQDQQVEQSDVQQGFAYQINFVGNVLGASNVPESMNGTTDPVSGVVTLPEQAPTADGYTFQGWATSEDGEVAYQAGQTLPIDEDTTMTLYGVWAKADTTKTKKASKDKDTEQVSYSITYASNEIAPNGLPDIQAGSVDKGDAIELSDDKPTADGYTFQGWATSVDGDVVYAPGASVTINEDTNLDLYAVWTKADTAKDKKASKDKETEKVNYSITYASNEIAPSGLPGIQAGTVNKGDSIQLSDAKPTADGYTFQGWATEINGAVVYAPGASITINDDTSLDLYAVWAQNTSVQIYNFDINYIENHLAASNMPTEQKGQTNENDNFVSLSDKVPTAAGYTFQGWTTKDGSSTVEYKPGQVIDIEKDTTLNLYGVWTKDKAKNTEKEINYNIFFSSNIKADKMPKTMSGVLKASEGNKVKLTTDTPTASGYTFVGWTTDSKGTKVEYKAGDTVTFKSDTSDVQNIQLYALWQKADTKSTTTSQANNNTTTTNKGGQTTTNTTNTTTTQSTSAKPASTTGVQTGAATNIGMYAGVTGAAAALLVALGLKKKFNK